ncbi:DUF2628 domain-containing protein [Mycolicibacterium brumae]|uniref:DUF2628 domain-containing protein n=1 Tax=Mycolicibacterium brumae TaxID=85968 RepID=A0A2G5PHI3_9MYCO|nr:DUF2628 domain-containing protein [Mycolicibacterium brumae]PIB77761.1 DUF2628 domain-containing protein [Mycolicibacterium brumae]
MWQARFKFYDKFGHPASQNARAAAQQLDFWSRFLMRFNLWALLFSPIYFFIKGMWRKGLTLLALNIAAALGLSAAGWPNQWANLVAGAIGLVTANWAYYLHVTQRSVSWNPFEGSALSPGGERL